MDSPSNSLCNIVEHEIELLEEREELLGGCLQMKISNDGKHGKFGEFGIFLFIHTLGFSALRVAAGRDSLREVTDDDFFFSATGSVAGAAAGTASEDFFFEGFGLADPKKRNMIIFLNRDLVHST